MGEELRQDTPQESAASGRRGLLLSALAAAGSFTLGWLLPKGRSDEPDDVGVLYHQWSTPGYTGILGTLRDWGQRPEPYKTYPGAERFALPNPHGYQGMSVGETLETRRSIREYVDAPLSLEELSRLLHAAQGITEPGQGKRTAPSAGALYPIELYAVVHNVTDLERGIYHYAVQMHELELLQQGDFQAAVREVGLGQEHLGRANVCFILSAIFQRTRWRYHERTYRYLLLEAGHIGQNLYLAATSMALGACAVGAFDDDHLNELLGLDVAEEAALYIVSVGKV
jgi:SagB-type dehydrogenase family enzyme